MSTASERSSAPDPAGAGAGVAGVRLTRDDAPGGAADGAPRFAAAAALSDASRHFHKRPRDPDATRAFLAERLARAESAPFLAVPAPVPAPVAATPAGGGAAVGLLHFYPGCTSIGLGRLWVRNDLFVTPAARGRGVGAALPAQARPFGVETGAVRLVLSTAVANPAQALYARGLGARRAVRALRARAPERRPVTVGCATTDRCFNTVVRA